MEEFKYDVKVKKMTKLINDELEFYSDDSDEDVSEEEWIKTKYYDSALFNGTILMIAN